MLLGRRCQSAVVTEDSRGEVTLGHQAVTRTLSPPAKGCILSQATLPNCRSHPSSCPKPKCQCPPPLISFQCHAALLLLAHTFSCPWVRKCHVFLVTVTHMLSLTRFCVTPISKTLQSALQPAAYNHVINRHHNSIMSSTITLSEEEIRA